MKKGDSAHRWESLYPVTCSISSLFLLRWFATSIHSLVGLVALGPSSFFLGDLSCVRRLYCFRHGYRPIPACSRGINTLPQVVMLSVPPSSPVPQRPCALGELPARWAVAEVGVSPAQCGTSLARHEVPRTGQQPRPRHQRIIGRDAGFAGRIVYGNTL